MLDAQTDCIALRCSLVIALGRILGEAGGGLRARQGTQNGCDYTVDVVHHIVVPEPQHAVALGSQEGGARGVIFFLVPMLAAIELNDQSLFRGTEVGNIWPDCVLSTEIESAQLAAAQAGP